MRLSSLIARIKRAISPPMPPREFPPMPTAAVHAMTEDAIARELIWHECQIESLVCLVDADFRVHRRQFDHAKRWAVLQDERARRRFLVQEIAS